NTGEYYSFLFILTKLKLRLFCINFFHNFFTFSTYIHKLTCWTFWISCCAVITSKKYSTMARTTPLFLTNFFHTSFFDLPGALFPTTPCLSLSKHLQNPIT